MQKPNPHLLMELKFIVPLLIKHPAGSASLTTKSQKKILISRRTYSAGQSLWNLPLAGAAKVKFIIQT